MATTGQHGAIGIVSATKGEVFAKGADGQVRRLAVGDNVYEGDVIVTANGSTAEITPFNGPVLNVQEQQTVAIDAQVAAPAHDVTAGAIAPLGAAEAAKVIQAVGPQAGQDFNATLDDEATAAGLAGGDGTQGGHNFVDLMRIIENVPTVGYDFPTNPPGTTPIITGQSATPITNTPETPPADPLANNDYSGLAMSDSGWKADGNVIWNDIPVVGAPIHISAVNGVAVSGDTATVRGAYGTLTIYANDVVDTNGVSHQMGDYSYVSDGIVFDILGKVTTYGTNDYGPGDWEDPGLDISTLGFGSDLDGVGFYGSTGVGVDIGDGDALITPGESLVLSMDQSVNSLTVSLGEISPQAGYMAYWYAYGDDGALIASGNFEDGVVDSNGLSLPIGDETTPAIKTLVIHNSDLSEGFDVTSVVYHGADIFTYTITDANGSQSTAELFITPDQGLDLTATNGGHIVVGSDNDFVFGSPAPAPASEGPSIKDFLVNPENLSGGAGNDVLSGGAGNDILTGGGGVDTFVWHLADEQTGSSPFAIDVVTDFGAGDVLELNDLITDTTTVQVIPLPEGDAVRFGLSGASTLVAIGDTAGAQLIILEGYTAANPTDMEAQLQTTTHFTG